MNTTEISSPSEAPHVLSRAKETGSTDPQPYFSGLQTPGDLDLAWAAGFVDGEGCIRIVKASSPPRVNPIYSLEVTISQNRLDVLKRLKNILGLESSIYLYPCRGPVRREVFALTYRCTRAREALVQIEPFLVRKKREAQLGIAFSLRISAPRVRRRLSDQECEIREAYYKAMQALK